MEYIDAKTILAKGHNEWFGSDYNINLYKGCSHGCIYCDSRSDCYRIVNFEQVKIKKYACEIFGNELKQKKVKGEINLGSMSDCYNPIEKEQEITRNALKLIDKYGFGVIISTKSDLVLRDIDLLKSISTHSPVLVKLTITTAYDTLCRKIEPNVCVSSRRFEVVKTLSESGIFSGIIMMPILPFIEDNTANILNILKLANDSLAKFVYADFNFGVTLRSNQREWFYSKIDTIDKTLKDKYINQFGDSYNCKSPIANELYETFVNECKKLKLFYKMEDIIAAYKERYKKLQFSMFD